MAEIKWIKITTDVFDDEKILLLESMPDADSLIVLWFKLLALAGKSNNNGVFMLNDKIPYTEEMLATIFRRPINTVRLALNTFEQFEMIERTNGVITIPNWEKHQNVDGMERIRERNRLRVAKHREKQKLLGSNVTGNVTSNVTVTDGNAVDKDKEEDKDKEKDKISYTAIADMYNSICVSYSKIRTLSEARKKTIKARFNSGYSIEDFKTLFEEAESSDFLKGKNGHNWTATFDWLIKDANMAKVLDGNYRNKQSEPKKDENPYEFLRQNGSVTTL